MVKISVWRIASIALAAVLCSLIVFLKGIWADNADNPCTVSLSMRVLGHVPQFKLTDQFGSAFGTRQLRGKYWFANFVFTRCIATCPAQTAKMAHLHEQLADLQSTDETYLVSFSVDPEHDTPEVLAQHAQQHHADVPQWRFLTGPRDEIWHLSKHGFKLAVGRNTPDEGSPLFHSPNIVLVDREGRIRGYFDGLTKEGIASAYRALQVIRKTNTTTSAATE